MLFRSTGTSRGLVNADSLSGALSTAATGSSGVGSYTIDATALANGNYLITANNGSLAISKAHLTVTADAQSRLYGAANPSFTETISGYVNSQDANSASVTGTATGSTLADATTGVGTPTITASTGTLAAANYDFTAANGTLTISQRPLTVTADGKTKTYGDANPALTYTVAADGTGTSRGLVNADSLSGALSTAATGSSGVGSYTIDRFGRASCRERVSSPV